MASFNGRTWRSRASVTTAGAIAGLAALTGTAFAATGTTLPAKGAALIRNGNFALPGPATHEGATPTGWKTADLGAEKKPFDATIGAYNAKGKFPPPAGNPNKSDIAAEDFYEAGTSVGIEGFGAQQSSFAVKTITQANNPQIGFSDAPTSAPQNSVTKWAGGGVQVVFASGKHTDTLTYFNMSTAPAGSYAGKPANTATSKFIVGTTLKLKQWTTWKARSLSADIKKEFGAKTYRVLDVRFMVLENATSNGGSNGPFPNETGFTSNLSVTEGAPVS